MPTYIQYDTDTASYSATKKRPSNQSAKKVLNKIAKRLVANVLKHPDLELTDLQAKFVQGVNHDIERYRLSQDDIDIAHGVAISMITQYFVKILNNPKSLNLDDANDFADAMLSTASLGDDKGRSTLREFFYDVKEGDDPEDLCERADKIIEMLNSCSRNLIPGYSAENRAIGAAADKLLFKKKKEAPGDESAYAELSAAKRAHRTFEKAQDKTYLPKYVAGAGGSLLLSSSLRTKGIVRNEHSNSDVFYVEVREGRKAKPS